MIQVTEPFLPPLDEYQALLKGIWDRNRLTNDGPLVTELEARLADYLGVKYLVLVANGTLALQLAVRAMELQGEVVTTPFSHVATTASLVWEGCTPRYADIHPRSWNLDPACLADSVTPETRGIVATHVYGNPCDVEAIQAVATKYGIPVIYDAAHCFGTRLGSRSVLEFGDVSAISFHATKVFHTVEGGGVVTRSAEVYERITWMRNFGHDGPVNFRGVGINAKLSEVHAAMGLCNLRYVDEILAKRAADCQSYEAALAGLPVTRPLIDDDVRYNAAYFPILLPSEAVLERAVDVLAARQIAPRRYFHPLLSGLQYVEGRDLPVAEDVASRVLCLPLSYQISAQEIEAVCGAVADAVREGEVA